jgi:hypothetical protein
MINMMFGSSLPPVICRGANILFTLFVFVCVWWCPTHIVLCSCFSSSCQFLWIVNFWLPLRYSLTLIKLMELLTDSWNFLFPIISHIFYIPICFKCYSMLLFSEWTFICNYRSLNPYHSFCFLLFDFYLLFFSNTMISM